MQKIFLWIFVWFSSISFGKPIPELSNFLDEELRNISQALSAHVQPLPQTESQSAAIELVRFFLLIEARFGFTIPHLTGLTVIPEVEFIWEPIPQKDASISD